MADFYGLIVFFVLSVFGSGVGATVPNTGTTYQYRAVVASGGGASPQACPGLTTAWTTNTAAGTSRAAYQTQCHPDFPWQLASCNDAVCTFNWQGAGGPGQVTDTLQKQAAGYSCPVGSSANGSGTCTCDSGYIENAGHTSCQTPQQATCALASGQAFWSTATGRATLGSTVCLESGCSGTWTDLVIYTDKATSQVMTEGNVKYSGAECMYTPSGPATATKDSCAGGSLGQVNGITTCVPYDPSKNTVEATKVSSSTASSSATPASGAASGTTTTTPGPTTTSQDSSVCDGGRCVSTTTTTTTNSDGSKSTSTVSKDVPVSDFCKDNPKASICQNPSTFGGTCDAGFTCNGDAAMCATARAVQALNCGGAEAALYEVEKNKAGDVTGSLPKSSTVTFTAQSFDLTDATGVAPSGMSDKSIEIWGHPYTVKFSVVNPWLELLGTIAVAVTMLLAARIVTRG